MKVKTLVIGIVCITVTALIVCLILDIFFRSYETQKGQITKLLYYPARTATTLVPMRTGDTTTYVPRTRYIPEKYCVLVALKEEVATFDVSKVYWSSKKEGDEVLVAISTGRILGTRNLSISVEEQ